MPEEIVERAAKALQRGVVNSVFKRIDSSHLPLEEATDKAYFETASYLGIGIKDVAAIVKSYIIDILAGRTPYCFR